MIYSKNNVLIKSSEFREDRTFNLGDGLYAQKLTVQLLSADRNNNFIYGPVIVQVTERPEHTYEDELNTQQWLELGFNSRGFATPITGARFRIPDLTEINKVQEAFLHFCFYG